MSNASFNTLGDSDKFKVTEFSFMGIPSDSYLYTCADCGGIQINVFPSIQSSASYSFENNIDFERKINAEYNRKDIAKLEMENVTQGGESKLLNHRDWFGRVLPRG
ncbi:Uncharacterised protein [Klebsiella pneumoniae subsp. rhinoscleromatis]|nr:Uncharacterised protein [Klebsiella pneumoniae subsp. rhinoscleromatis]